MQISVTLSDSYTDPSSNVPSVFDISGRITRLRRSSVGANNVQLSDIMEFTSDEGRKYNEYELKTFDSITVFLKENSMGMIERKRLK